jgi:hypothetical protein
MTPCRLSSQSGPAFPASMKWWFGESSFGDAGLDKRRRVYWYFFSVVGYAGCACVHELPCTCMHRCHWQKFQNRAGLLNASLILDLSCTPAVGPNHNFKISLLIWSYSGFTPTHTGSREHSPPPHTVMSTHIHIMSYIYYDDTPGHMYLSISVTRIYICNTVAPVEYICNSVSVPVSTRPRARQSGFAATWLLLLYYCYFTTLCSSTCIHEPTSASVWLRNSGIALVLFYHCFTTQWLSSSGIAEWLAE